MEATDLLRDLFKHMEWADALVWKTVLESRAATEDRIVCERLRHIHLVQRAFLLVWRGQPVDFRGTESHPAAQLARWGREYYGEVAGFLDTLDPSSLDDPVRLPWAARVVARLAANPGTPSLGETLAQVAAHSTYHRGQVNSRLRELGLEPPLTDFIAWVWSAKPAPRWPSDTE